MADKSIVGRAGKPFKMPIEWSKVREFARAIKDPDLLYFDPEKAKKELGGIPVPVTFLQTSAFWTDADSGPGMGNFDLRRILHGEQEFDYHRPIVSGDVLDGEQSITDIYEKDTDAATMTFVVMETRWIDAQSGDPVVTERFNLIARLRKESGS